MARCGCTSVCSCLVQGGESVTVTGVGSFGNPYVVSVPCEVIQDCIGSALGPGMEYDDANNQILVRISDDAGNVLVFGSDEGFYAPTSPVAIGCGLDFGVGGEIIVDTSGAFADLRRLNAGSSIDDGTDAALTCPDTSGQIVYCDSAGELRTAPEKFTDTNVSSVNEGYAPVESLPFTTSAQLLTLTNHSSCYAMCGYLWFATNFTISATPNAQPQLIFEFDFNGDGVFDGATFVWSHDTRGSSSNVILSTRPVMQLNLCLQPGETRTIQVRSRFQFGPAHAGGNAQISAAAREARWFGTNL